MDFGTRAKRPRQRPPAADVRIEARGQRLGLLARSPISSFGPPVRRRPTSRSARSQRRGHVLQRTMYPRSWPRHPGRTAADASTQPISKGAADSYSAAGSLGRCTRRRRRPRDRSGGQGRRASVSERCPGVCRNVAAPYRPARALRTSAGTPTLIRSRRLPRRSRSPTRCRNLCGARRGPRRIDRGDSARIRQLRVGPARAPGARRQRTKRQHSPRASNTRMRASPGRRSSQHGTASRRQRAAVPSAPRQSRLLPHAALLGL